MLLVLLACTTKTGLQPGPDHSEPVDTGYLHTSVEESGDDGEDADGDGFTVEEGDCDDSSVYASPAREEDDDDKIDNDCDGRVDEAWVGLDVAYLDEAGSSELYRFDPVGRIDDELRLSDGCAPLWLDAASRWDSDAGWIASDYANVLAIDPSGECTALWDFSKEPACTDLMGVFGVATGHDGTIYATTLDKLWAIDPKGTVEAVASWDCSLAGKAHALAAYSLAVDQESGEVAIFGYFGGFATWSPASGLVIAETEDLKKPAVYTYAGAHADEGGWYTPGIDGTTGAYGVYQYEAGWQLAESWKDEDWVPFALTIDGDSGDYYVTANAGWYYTVWRIVEGSGYAADLYSSDGDEPNRMFSGIVSRYAYGG